MFGSRPGFHAKYGSRGKPFESSGGWRVFKPMTLFQVIRMIVRSIFVFLFMKKFGLDHES